jgi:hypothetical protein
MKSEIKNEREKMKKGLCCNARIKKQQKRERMEGGTHVLATCILPPALNEVSPRMVPHEPT